MYVCEGRNGTFHQHLFLSKEVVTEFEVTLGLKNGAEELFRSSSWSFYSPEILQTGLTHKPESCWRKEERIE